MKVDELRQAGNYKRTFYPLVDVLNNEGSGIWIDETLGEEDIL